MDEAIKTVPSESSRSDVHDVYIEIDLEELMGQPVKDDGLKEEIGLALVNTIVDRTRAGKFKTNEKKSYSEEYKESLPYRVAGKDGTVNMQLTGDMMNSLDVINVDDQKVIVGFMDDLESKKAHNHNFGITVPQREFMYASQKEIAQIRRDFKPRLGPSPRELQQEEERLQGFLGLLRNFF